MLSRSGEALSRFDGFIRQPKDTGPVLFSNSSPSYPRLAAAVASAGTGGGDDGGGGSGAVIAIVVVVVAVLGAGAWFVMRRRTAYERE